MKIAPLKGSLMATAIGGFLLSWFLMQNTTLPTFRDLMISTMILCVIIIIASFISMTYGPVADYDIRRGKHVLSHHVPPKKPDLKIKKENKVPSSKGKKTKTGSDAASSLKKGVKKRKKQKRKTSRSKKKVSKKKAKIKSKKTKKSRKKARK